MVGDGWWCLVTEKLFTTLAGALHGVDGDVELLGGRAERRSGSVVMVADALVSQQMLFVSQSGIRAAANLSRQNLYKLRVDSPLLAATPVSAAPPLVLDRFEFAKREWTLSLLRSPDLSHGAAACAPSAPRLPAAPAASATLPAVRRCVR